MTIKVFYYPGRLDTPSWLETHNINRANEQLNPIDFDSYLRAKVADIASRFNGKRRLKVELHRNTSDNRVLIEEIKINNKIVEDAERK
jgi:hypothetical protein